MWPDPKKSAKVFASGTPCSNTMTLTDLLSCYLRANECSPRYEESLRRTVRKAEMYRLTKVCQLGADRVNEFLAALTVGPTTRHNIRRELLTLWRFAHDRDMVQEYPSRVRRIAPKYAAPQAWSYTELVNLLRLAEKDKRFVSSRVSLRRCDVLPVWLTVGYESGLRLTDLVNLKTADFRNGCVSVRASKTGKITIRRICHDTQKRVEELCAKSPDGTVFRWALPRRRAILLWAAFLKEHKYRGSSKWLRRSGATALESIKPGMATRWLDHSNPALARKHYLDATLMDLPDSPPPLN